MATAANCLSIIISRSEAVTHLSGNIDYRLEQIEATGADCKLRLIFKNSPVLRSYVCEKLCSEILQYARCFEKTGSVFSAPDYIFENEELILGRCC